MKDFAIKYYEAGLMPIPVNPQTKLREFKDDLGNHIQVGFYKNDRLDRWQKKSIEKVFKNAKGIAIVCGKASGGIEALDMEGKFDVTGMLFENFKHNLITRLGKDFFKSLVIQKTQHKGWHIYYKCPEIVNQPQKTKLGLWGSKVLALNRNGKCLIETRSNPSYSIVYPTEGYHLIQGNYENIPAISPQEYFTIHSICKEIHEGEQKMRRG